MTDPVLGLPKESLLWWLLGAFLLFLRSPASAAWGRSRLFGGRVEPILLILDRNNLDVMDSILHAPTVELEFLGL